MVMEVVHEETGEGSMLQCASHPYKNSSPGGICAFCLQEKLGKLVSSSFPLAVFPPPPSSSSPSFRSEVGAPISSHHNPPPSDSGGSNNRRRTARSKLPFRLSRKKKRPEERVMVRGRNNCSDSATFVFMRSKSMAAPGKALHFLDENHKRGFWSFLYNPKDSGFKKSDNQLNDSGGTSGSKDKKTAEMVLVEEDANPGEVAVDRKVSRSKSIGCGNRSFSGDFFERISTGFSDCTLRRAQSHREGKMKAKPVHRNGRGEGDGQDCINGRVKCGRIFGGFMIRSSSSSSTSSNWVSSSAEDTTIARGKAMTLQSHWRSRNWGWSLPSSMRPAKPRPRKTDSDSCNLPQT